MEREPLNVREGSQWPVFPPGLWRRILLQPGPGWIGAALEDDMHRFHLRLDHDGVRIKRVAARALRHPWTACPGAAAHLAGELEGELLVDVARRDPMQHCTHLFDLAVLCAAHAGDTGATRFDMRVADRVDGRATAMLAENGEQAVLWRLDGTMIAGPDPWTGKDLRQLSKWKAELSTRDAERAMLLRRAVFISGGRQFVAPAEERAAEQGPMRMGVCYNYQMPQAADSKRMPDWRTDFSAGGRQPLAGFDPEELGELEGVQ